MVLMVLSFAWGLAEETLFFLVPDIILTWVVLRRPEYIVSCYCLTLLGALVGGVIMEYQACVNIENLNLQGDCIP